MEIWAEVLKWTGVTELICACCRRLKIEVDGQPVVDVANVMLEPTHFEHYWINVADGVLTVGKGDPGKGVICQWADSKPKCAIQYVGLSSWDKHVVYRNIQVLPALQPPRMQIPQDNGGFTPYLENEELADLQFVVANDNRIVPAHKILLALSCSKFFDICTSPAGMVHMPQVDYQTLHAFLEFIYTGHTQVGMLFYCWILQPLYVTGHLNRKCVTLLSLQILIGEIVRTVTCSYSQLCLAFLNSSEFSSLSCWMRNRLT